MMASAIDVAVEVRNRDFLWGNVGSHVTQSEALVSSEVAMWLWLPTFMRAEWLDN
jgi:hypothetical protein